MRRGMGIVEISHLTGRGKKVVKQHLEFIKQYFPELFETRQLPDKCPDTGAGCFPKTSNDKVFDESGDGSLTHLVYYINKFTFALSASPR